MKTTLGGKSNVFDRAFQWADWPHENVAGSGIQRDQRQPTTPRNQSHNFSEFSLKGKGYYKFEN